MPHLTIEYSANLEGTVDIQALCETLKVAAVETGLFPLAGTRVRAMRCEAYAIADGRPDAAFIDISVRLRGGRDLDVRKAATASLFEAAERLLENEFERRPLALSLEMRNIDPELSPKRSSIRDHMARSEAS